MDGDLASFWLVVANSGGWVMLSSLSKLAGLAAAVVMLYTANASAVGLAVNDWSFQDGPNNAGITYAQGFGAYTPSGATWTGEVPLVDASAAGGGSVPSEYKSPFNTNALEDNRDYFSVGSPNQPAGQGSISPNSLKWSSAQDFVLSMLWGSIDTYNSIQFLIGGVLQDTITGSDVLAAIVGGAGQKVALVTFTGRWDEMVFVSDQAALEHAFAVPLPPAALLLLGALGGLGYLSRRRGKEAATA